MGRVDLGRLAVAQRLDIWAANWRKLSEPGLDTAQLPQSDTEDEGCVE